MNVDVITIGAAAVPRGQVGYGEFKAGELRDGSPVNVPFVIVNGVGAGPVLWVHHGVHGNETVGMGAIQRLLKELDPASMRGAVIMVPMVNVLGLRAVERAAPQDGMDANRIWPGKPLHEAMHVTAHSEMLINALFTLIREHADYVVDCHDGSTLAAMAPWASYYTGPEEWERKSRGLAIASGMTAIWKTNLGDVAEKFPGSAALELSRINVPAIFLEVGGRGALEQEDVARMHLCLSNAVRHLGILDGEVRIPEKQIVVHKGHWLRPSVGGVFWRQVELMQQVGKNDVVAIVTDLFGREKERLLAPAAGVIIGIRTAATTASGEYAGNVAELDPVQDLT